VQQVRGGVVGGSRVAFFNIHYGLENRSRVGWHFRGDVHAQVVFFLNGFNDQALAVRFQVAAVAHLSAHFGIKRCAIQYQLVIRFALLGNLSVFQNLRIARRKIVAYELGFLIFQNDPVARFHSSGIAGTVFLFFHGGCETVNVGSKVVFAQNQFRQIHWETKRIVNGEHAFTVQNRRTGSLGFGH